VRRVLAALDNSAAARPVLAMGRAVAAALGAGVEAVHVLENGHETVAASADAAGVALRTLAGDPAELLTAALAEPEVAALVLGQRGMAAGPRPAGHVVLTVAGRTDKPVVVVPPGVEPAERLSTVLVAMEGTPGKARALRRTIELSHEAGLEPIVVHVDEEVPSFTDQVQHEADAYAREFLSRSVSGLERARFELRIGVPADEVLAAVASLRPDLVAVGWPHSSVPGRGDVAREILARSPAPVVLVAVV